MLKAENGFLSFADSNERQSGQVRVQQEKKKEVTSSHAALLFWVRFEETQGVPSDYFFLTTLAS